jgi:8-oxo-dGTP pyrophosphatase MutT (NUDIX family)
MMPIRPAATVIVLRLLGHGPSALMVRRNAKLKYFGGFWVFPGGVIDAADASIGTDVVQAAAIGGCRELREEAGLDLDPTGLVHFGRWITPSAAPRRYNTHFFLGAAPPGQEPRLCVDEVTALEWLPVTTWPTLTETGPFPVPKPTQLVLREVAEAFARHGSVEALLERERGRPIRCVLPKILDEGRIILPWAPGYEDVPGEGMPWAPDEVATRRHWPSRV